MIGSCVVVVGNPIDGIQLVGPFPDSDTANEFAEQEVPGSSEWWVAKLTPPEEY